MLLKNMVEEVKEQVKNNLDKLPFGISEYKNEIFKNQDVKDPDTRVCWDLCYWCTPQSTRYIWQDEFAKYGAVDSHITTLFKKVISELEKEGF